MSARQTDLLQEEIRKMLKYQVIEIGESDYTPPMILVETRGRDPRPCIDYRKLNEIPLTPKVRRLTAFTTSFETSSITYAILVKKCALLFQQIDG
ncbi:hypothetical protein TNIN_12251 [Trichonephila inaurata madagascariensis]|uniref:Uncharacterized protein n=1 Tax=Trichonephila inaurata madagascariensis TaxID=2747483 RepID=A0A8X6Y2B6_9ARAC|nr:hypothetical protein TNIN_12251 [Trichonephila inaurata madagascariensis]